MKLPYCEGTWFAVPLKKGGFAVGVVARTTKKGKVILCYFFGPRLESIPSLKETEIFNPIDSVLIVHVGDLGLIQGEWSIIGLYKSWNRADWPIPPFIRRNDISQKAWLDYYSDDDPNILIRTEPVPYDTTSYGVSSVYGASAAEIALDKLLK